MGFKTVSHWKMHEQNNSKYTLCRADIVCFTALPRQSYTGQNDGGNCAVGTEGPCVLFAFAVFCKSTMILKRKLSKIRLTKWITTLDWILG